MSEAGGRVAILAILAAPIAMKIPFGPVPLSPTDLFLATAIALMAAARVRWSNVVAEVQCLEPCTPFLVAMVVAALVSHEHAVAVKELLQVLLCAAAGVWLFSTCARDVRWRRRCFFGIRATILFALIGLAIQRAFPATPAVAPPYSRSATGMLQDAASEISPGSQPEASIYRRLRSAALTSNRNTREPRTLARARGRHGSRSAP